jgi:prepilin-type processing-associated H-X9-DG protein
MERGRSSQCRSNLRQLGAAFLLYSGDHGQLPPSYGYGFDNVFHGDFQDQINDYTEGRANGVWVCKSIVNRVTKPDAATYAAHGNIFVHRPTADFANPQHAAYTPLAPMSRMARPSQMIAVADTSQIYADGSGGPALTHEAYSDDPARADTPVDTMYPANLTGNADLPKNTLLKTIRYRHDNGLSANAVMLDGHLQSFQTNQILNRNLSFRNY